MSNSYLPTGRRARTTPNGMKKNIIILTLTLLIIGGFYATKNSPVAKSEQQNNNLKTYTIEEVRLANSAQKCLTIIDKKVYNITNYVNQHPGGSENILSICGKDGTSAFERQHGNNQGIINVLSKFIVGEIK